MNVYPGCKKNSPPPVFYLLEHPVRFLDDIIVKCFISVTLSWGILFDPPIQAFLNGPGSERGSKPNSPWWSPLSSNFVAKCGEKMFVIVLLSEN